MDSFLPEALAPDGLRQLLMPIVQQKPHYLCVCANMNWVAKHQPGQFAR